MYEYCDYDCAERVEEAAVKSNAQHDPIHNQVNRYAVKQAANNCVMQKKPELATQDVKDDAGHEGDKEVHYQAEGSRSQTTFVGVWAKQSAGNRLQDPYRAASAQAAVEECRGYVQGSGDQSAPQNCPVTPRLFH